MDAVQHDVSAQFIKQPMQLRYLTLTRELQHNGSSTNKAIGASITLQFRIKYKKSGLKSRVLNGKRRFSIAMVDVRAMLRTERASRAPKQSKTHTIQQQSQQLQSKKRKANNEIADENENRKRSKAPYEEDLTIAPTHEETSKSDSEANVIQSEASAMVTNASVDEDEWAAFEREVATSSPSPPRQTALEVIRSKADISSAPLTAAELEERRKEELKQVRIQREEDDEAEKEDAANRMVEEFEEMAALEERVRKLKEMREKLRQAPRQDEGVNPLQESPATSAMNGQETEEESDDDKVDDDDDDGWGFRR
jgi:hypothetical protein